MRIRPKIVLWAVALAVLALPTLATQGQAQTEVTLRSLSDAAIGDYGSDGRYYVGPYGFQVGSDTGTLWDFYCVDFSRRVTTGETFEAHYTSLASGSDLSNTYKRDLMTYQMAAYLANQFNNRPQDQWGELHAAIWQITGAVPTWGDYGAAPTNGEADSDLTRSLIADAEENYASLGDDFQYWTVVTDTEGTRQEFLTYTTPEPTSMLLLGTGLAGVAWFRRKRDGEVESEDDVA